MEKFDSVIIISPNLGEHYKTDVFLRSMTDDEIVFADNTSIIEYRKTHDSYIECMKDLKDKLSRIKTILKE
jgi:hypothetical protein